MKQSAFPSIVLGIFATVVLASCDSGSTIRLDRDGAQCHVSMERNEDGFRVEMTLTCTDEGADCYVIESLTCQGDTKSEAVPIDLEAGDDGCPGRSYCVESCDDGLEAPGTLWDMPSLLATEGCNVYDDA